MDVVLICPCCASTVDAEARDELQEFVCGICQQTWTMVVSADRYATHSLS